MTKDVFVSVTGLQVMGECQGAQHPIEMVTVGEYHFKNGKHFIRFDEAFEGFSESTVNLTARPGYTEHKIGKEAHSYGYAYHNRKFCKSGGESGKTGAAGSLRHMVRAL
ncbi:MAG: DUF1934 domain-containing protein [Lachnospiraceae bacterium]|nr:DUF1934 domain-containing protein [Lachnospiraceae bacterium]